MGCQHLQGSNLSSNALTSLPEGVFNGLSALRVLFLNNNALTSLPVNVFSGLSTLLYLHLQHNALSTLPAGCLQWVVGTHRPRSLMRII